MKLWGGEDMEKPDRKNCPVWNHRSSAPPGPLPKKASPTIRVGVVTQKTPDQPTNIPDTGHLLLNNGERSVADSDDFR